MANIELNKLKPTQIKTAKIKYSIGEKQTSHTSTQLFLDKCSQENLVWENRCSSWGFVSLSSSFLNTIFGCLVGYSVQRI